MKRTKIKEAGDGRQAGGLTNEHEGNHGIAKIARTAKIAEI
jgi:hypothetical protein